MILWSWFLILTFDLKEEVTQTKRAWERQREINCSLSRENFERGGARENQREETLAKFPKPRRRGRA